MAAHKCISLKVQLVALIKKVEIMYTFQNFKYQFLQFILSKSQLTQIRNLNNSRSTKKARDL